MERLPYSVRKGTNPFKDGFDLATTIELFEATVSQLRADGYMHEYFGFCCVDEPDGIRGKIFDIDREILLKVRKKNMWPISNYVIKRWTEDDLFDMMEFLYERVSKPLSGDYHNFSDCGMHWKIFSEADGRKHFIRCMNEVLSTYKRRFLMSDDGYVLEAAEKGFEGIFDAKLPTADKTIVGRINAATNAYRRHGATSDDRRHAVRDLADVLELLRPKMKGVITSKDEDDLFNIANSFGIRHQNDKQKNNYEKSLWSAWMFYYYLATIHLVLRRLG